MNSKQLSIALGIAVVVLLAVVGYMALRDNSQNDTLSQQSTTPNSNLADSNTNTQPPSNTPPTQSDETASWKTFSNQQYGFSVKYPANLPVQTSNSGPGNKTFILSINSVRIIGDRDGDPKYLWITVEPKRQLIGCTGDAKAAGTIMIDSVSATKCTVQGSYFDEGLGMYAEITSGSYTYTFSADYYDKNKATVDKMISTFKFTN